MDHWILQFMARKISFDQYDWMTRIFIFCARKIQKIHANSADRATLQFAQLADVMPVAWPERHPPPFAR